MVSVLLAGLLLLVPASDVRTADEAPILAPDVGPGDGLVLSPIPAVVTPVSLPQRSSGPTRRGFGATAGMSVVAGAAALALLRRKRDDEPFYVVVHGNGGSGEDFDRLLELMGVSQDRVVSFDYSNGDPNVTSTRASTNVRTEDAAAALDALIRDLSEDYSNIYSIHHSRGGAIGVTMIAALDDGRAEPIDGYVGAALLDPAIDGGLVGVLQRAGSFSYMLPDNGDFNPHQCFDGECRDIREHLGKNSGVEVIAVRNPDAIVTNFRDSPDGLRVYDLQDDGGVSAAWWAILSPILAVWRVSQAHASVRVHPTVANCLSAEVALGGSCVWQGSTLRPARKGGGGSTSASLK